GEVHALLGENGAGKSTLMRVLAGAEQMDSGEIRLFGRLVHLNDPLSAMRHGVAMIYQELNLVPTLGAAENIFMGRMPSRAVRGVVDFGRVERLTSEYLQRLGVSISPRMPIERLSVAQQQMVEIAKAVSQDARVIVMDEPSATLTEHELTKLFELIRRLRDSGTCVVYISHRLEEVFEVCDRATVLRDGQVIESRAVPDWTHDDIVRAMVGREIVEQYPRRSRDVGDVVLEVCGLSRVGVLHDVSLKLRRGEIVGVAGLVGAGRTELARAIFGADPVDAGAIRLEGRTVRIRSPRDAIRCGIGMLSEDRKAFGLVVGMTVRENCTMTKLSSVSSVGVISRSRERAVATGLVQSLGVRTPSIEQAAENLSGGNQQKLVLAKWLFTECQVLIFDEPTRGVDVGAKVEIYGLMNDLADRGVCILMISSDLPEVLGMSDRILVMREGRIVGEADGRSATQEGIMRMALGVADAEK
ncbi:MAG: sugar ABC transporter ATP-binding protein, partial [Fimbriimonadia bacterium]